MYYALRFLLHLYVGNGHEADISLIFVSCFSSNNVIVIVMLRMCKPTYN